MSVSMHTSFTAAIQSEADSNQKEGDIQSRVFNNKCVRAMASDTVKPLIPEKKIFEAAKLNDPGEVIEASQDYSRMIHSMENKQIPITILEGMAKESRAAKAKKAAQAGEAAQTKLYAQAKLAELDPTAKVLQAVLELEIEQAEELEQGALAEQEVLAEHAEQLTLKVQAMPQTIVQEKEAAQCFISSLRKGIPIQERLSKLDINQIRVFLTCTYVEASHHLSQLIAFNIPDESDHQTYSDDNGGMLEGYTSFLSNMNRFASTHETKSDGENIGFLKGSIKKLIGILVNGGGEFNYNSSCQYAEYDSQSRLYYGPHLFDRSGFQNVQAYIAKHKLQDLDETVVLVQRNNLFCLGIRGIEAKNKVLEKLAIKLYDAFKEKDIPRAFKLTSDFQYAHTLPNANGRVSQVIRDCFALALGEPPFSALTNMSHYLYLSGPVDKEHLKFMQSNSMELLSSVESKTITYDFIRKDTKEQIDRLYKKSNKNPPTLTDIAYFEKLIKLRSDKKHRTFTPFPTTTGGSTYRT